MSISSAVHLHAQVAPRDQAIVRQEEASFAGDLDQIRQRAKLRVLVSYSRTNFFISEGRPRGFSCDLLNEYGEFLCRELRIEKSDITIEYVVLAPDELLPALLDGRGDIAAAIVVTPERQRQVSFTEPYLTGVNEIIVASKSAPKLKGLDDLAERRIYAVKGSFAADHLAQLSAQAKLHGRGGFQVIQPADALASEDLLEMVNAGMIQYACVDAATAEVWAEVLHNLSLRPDLTIHRDDKLAMAVRPTNPKLLASLNEFVRTHRKGTLAGNELFRRYFDGTHWLENPLIDDPLKRLRGLEQAFRKYGMEYGFDWRFLAAQGFQESRLDQAARSSVGAVGIMQLESATARELGFTNIAADAAENIHAGAKYMADLRDRYFSSEPEISPAARLHFTLAAYNAGPGNVQKWRTIARSRGMDPNRWLCSVERISVEHIGEQTYQYVRNIDKYFLAYVEAEQLLHEREVDLGGLKN